MGIGRTSGLCVAVALLALGCAAATLTSLEAEQRSKKLLPIEGKASVYVICRCFIQWDAWTLELDGVTVGSLARDTYTVLELDPGQHALVSDTRRRVFTMPIDVQAGEVRFVAASRFGNDGLKEITPDRAEQLLWMKSRSWNTTNAVSEAETPQNRPAASVED